MANGNGKLWVGIISVVLVLFGMTFSPLVANVIANDKDSRTRDSEQIKRIACLEKQYGEINTKLFYIERGQGEQKLLTQQILEKLG